MKQFFISNKGMGVVEILVSLCIISLIAMAILPAITMGFIQIEDSGSETKAIYSVQDSIETGIVQEQVDATDEITIVFSGVTLNINGTILEQEAEYGSHNQSINVKVFVPNK